MILNFEPLRNKLAEPLLAAIEKCGVTSCSDEVYKFLVEPPNPDMGHLAFGCFVVAKGLKKAPAQAAADIKNNLGQIDGVVSVDAAGPAMEVPLFNIEFLAIGFPK